MTEKATGLRNFGRYMAKMLTIDTLFLNEDRHTHIIAVLTNARGDYACCPIFDQGAGLLADTTMDYPLGEDIYALMSTVRPKTFCESFDEQLEIAEELYGEQIHFSCTRKDVETMLSVIPENMYGGEILSRVRDVLFEQMRKYGYLFKT